MLDSEGGDELTTAYVMNPVGPSEIILNFNSKNGISLRKAIIIRH